jgi:hypothetical protein
VEVINRLQHEALLRLAELLGRVGGSAAGAAARLAIPARQLTIEPIALRGGQRVDALAQAEGLGAVG